ncbi:MAG: hypothetical protein PWP49_280 [Thermococcaceae archaeon]|jgi:hypothetical protein|nr:MAG: hypothetical protein XD43_0300 [Thermococcales archaeon 44_46]MDK2783396.1 hypothetical protein [Thermococcaceae archaeon]MDK2853518.1 hypothetical protein [Thermococcaceae archaeon]MDK2982683.1 hypothetical protein [Thermococcaceae archaeon]MDN5319860.1 hypothetical protein [Thermococcaceae archaeon]
MIAEIDVETMECLINFDIMFTFAKKFFKKKGSLNSFLLSKKKKSEKTSLIERP